MGLNHHDRYKQLKIMQDADQIVSECQDLIVQNGLNAETARGVIVKGMLGDQPLPLKDNSIPVLLTSSDPPAA
jgi:heterodisulfide reductase subunit D